MRKLYERVETVFEKFTMLAVRIFSNPITFIAACCVIIYWLAILDYQQQSLQETVRDFITAITFLSFFMIQKWFNHLSIALHLKLNELVATHENASNELVKAENKSESQLRELSKSHDEIAAKNNEGNLNSPLL